MTFPNYEGYEQLSGFTPGQLQSYRNMLLEKTRPQVEFIQRHITHRPLQVMEIGAGNGRLLIGLALSSYVGYAVGYELSESRVKFANNWARDYGVHKKVEILLGNALEVPPMYPAVDLAVCITGCFQYFYPAAPDAPAKALQLMRLSANYALFELYRKPPMGRTWHKLPEGDPWSYLLDEYEDTGNWVRHTKTFLSLKSREWDKDVRVENLAYYRMDQFLALLWREGFTNIHWAKQNSQSMVVLVS